MVRMEKKKRREGLEEFKKKIIPTITGMMQRKNLSREKATQECMKVCAKAHKNSDCFRRINGHKPCDRCPKYFPAGTKERKTGAEWERIRVGNIVTTH